MHRRRRVEEERRDPLVDAAGLQDGARPEEHAEEDEEAPVERAAEALAVEHAPRDRDERSEREPGRLDRDEGLRDEAEDEDAEAHEGDALLLRDRAEDAGLPADRLGL